MRTSEFEPQAAVATTAQIAPTITAGVDPRLQLKLEIRFYLGLLSMFVVYVTIFLTLWVVVPIAIAGWTPVVITSGSMFPTIGVGDVLVVAPHDGLDLESGQIVIFEDPVRPGTITHRIVEVYADGSYQTKGDANVKPDSTPLQPDQVVGEARFLIPFVGLPFKWASAGEWLKLFLFVGLMGWSVVFARYGQSAKYDPWADPEDSPWEKWLRSQNAGPELPERGGSRSSAADDK